MSEPLKTVNLKGFKIDIYRPTADGKKYKAKFKKEDGKTKTLHFGQRGYE